MADFTTQLEQLYQQNIRGQGVNKALKHVISLLLLILGYFVLKMLVWLLVWTVIWLAMGYLVAALIFGFRLNVHLEVRRFGIRYRGMNGLQVEHVLVE